MEYGIKSMRRLQFGQEVTPGTKVAASTKWRGEGTVEDTRTVVNPVEDVGLVVDTDRQYVPLLGGKLPLASTPATFEQLGHILNMGLHYAAPTQDGASTASDYISTYNLPTTSVYSASDLGTYTVEAGDNAGAEVMEYVHCTDFGLDWVAGEALMLTANLAGRQVVPQAFTGGLQLPDVEEILGSKCKLYIDDVGGSIGTTQAANTVLGGSLKVTTGWRGVPASDGDLFFSFVKQVKPVITLDITFEHNSIGIAEKAKWIAKSPRLIRVEFDGSALSVPGSTFDTKALVIDLCGKYTKFAALSDKDGDDTIVASFVCGYNATASLFAQLKLITELAALP